MRRIDFLYKTGSNAKGEQGGPGIENQMIELINLETARSLHETAVQESNN